MGLLSWLSWSPRDEDMLKETRTRGAKSRSGSRSPRNGREGVGRGARRSERRQEGVKRGGRGAEEVVRQGTSISVATKAKGGSHKKVEAKEKPLSKAKRAPKASIKSRPSNKKPVVKKAPSITKHPTSRKGKQTGHGNERKAEQANDLESSGSPELSGYESESLAEAPRQRQGGQETRQALKKKAQKPTPKATPTTPYTLPSHFTKSLWKVRPLQVDEKLRVFIEGRDDGIQRYDGGEFQQWLEDCKAGRGDPLEAGAYPLVVQDSDLRQVLEIKFPSERALATLEDEYGYDLGLGTLSAGGSGRKKAPGAQKNQRETQNASTHADHGENQDKIAIPQWKKLPSSEWPDTILRQTMAMPLLVRTVDGGAEPAERKPPQVADDTQHERAYIRYMMPTPDDWDQAIEYDLDEDDEKWLEAYNRRSKNNNNSTLKEEWLEHLIDRMEKEYTSELQKHPEKWISKRLEGAGGEDGGAGGSGGPLAYMKGQLPPPLILPSISEMFPLNVCMKVFGLGGSGGGGTSGLGASEGTSVAKKYAGSPVQIIDEKIIKDVYTYWKRKHQKSGLPLIQRLWYEPPWHRKASDEDLDGGDDETVFSGFDLHPSLARIRKRKMNDDEVQLRFDCLRRDFEQVRTIADLIRRREKLKLQETSILKQEWASRMNDVHRACRSASTSDHPGTLTFSRPPKLASLVESRRSTVASREHRQDFMAEQEQKLAIERTLSEDRAARLAARRDVRAEALRIRRERIATKKSTSKPRPKKAGDKKPKKSTTKKATGNKQPRSSTGQFQSFKGK